MIRNDILITDRRKDSLSLGSIIAGMLFEKRSCGDVEDLNVVASHEFREILLRRKAQPVVLAFGNHNKESSRVGGQLRLPDPQADAVGQASGVSPQSIVGSQGVCDFRGIGCEVQRQSGLAMKRDKEEFIAR